MEIENLRLQKEIDSIIDKIYPVGSYYETSDDSFNPNISWGGTWVEETDGSVLICQGKYYNGILATVGATIGEDDIQLKENQLPTHSHKYDKLTGIMGHTLTIDEMPSHTHTTAGGDRYVLKPTGGNQEFGTGGSVSTKLQLTNTGGGKPHTHGLSYTETNTHTYGKTQSRTSVVQKSKVVARWHRTA